MNTRMKLSFLLFLSIFPCLTWTLTNVSFFDFIGDTGEIFAIGDSLTFGQVLHQRNGKKTTSFRSYAKTLQNMMQSSSKTKVVAETYLDVTFPRLFLSVNDELVDAKSILLKAAIVLAGYEEIYGKIHTYGYTPNMIVHSIVQILEIYFRHKYDATGIPTDRVSFLVTLPEFKPPADEKKEAARLEVNKLLRSFASRCKQRVILIEASTLFGDNIKYFSDENYLSTEGYDAIANLVYETLKTTTVPKMSSSERQAYIDKCFSGSYSLLNNLKNGTILAIGDSLTAGISFSDGVTRRSPYTDIMHGLFLTRGVNGVFNDTISVVEKGQSGEMTNHMRVRLDKTLQELESKSAIVGALKMVAIWGGTNDLAAGRTASEVVDDILAMHESVLRYRNPHLDDHRGSGNRTSDVMFSIAITIPPNGRFGDDQETNRLNINKEIRKFASRCRDRVALVDVDIDAFDQKSHTEEWSPELIHFSVKGYADVGILVHNAILRLFDSRKQNVHNLLSDEAFYSKCFPTVGVSDKTVDIVQPEVSSENDSIFVRYPVLLLNQESILAFGDSLTVGYSSVNGTLNSRKSAYDEHPYTLKLNTLLNKPVANRSGHSIHTDNTLAANVTVLTKGLSGELTEDMLHRLEGTIEEAENGYFPKAVLLLGGTNDALRGQDSHDAIRNIFLMHEKVLTIGFVKSRHLKSSINGNGTHTIYNRLLVSQSHAVRHTSNSSVPKNSDVDVNVDVEANELAIDIPRFTVAMTLPQFRAPHKLAIEVRDEINKGLRKFAENCKERIVLLDMETLFNQNMKENERYWNYDGFHFSHEGYDKIGSILYEKITHYLAERANLALKGGFESNEAFFKKCFGLMRHF